MGIPNPTLTSDKEFFASYHITHDLTEIIYRQEEDLSNYDPERVATLVKHMKSSKQADQEEDLKKILELVDSKTKRIMELNQEKGAGLWLTANPVKSHGFTLNKQEFKDSISLRYGWKIPNVSSYCQCGEKNSIDHALSCKKGGYVIMRHNKIRDLVAELMQEVCHDVKIEPPLLPVVNDHLLRATTNTQDNARLDVSGIGLYSPHEVTYGDIKVFHPNCKSYIDKDLATVYATHEKQKKTKYNERVVQVQKGSFTPIVMSTFGGMGVEATKFHKRLGQLIAKRRGETYSAVMNYIRTRLRFSLLKSVLTSIRGIREKKVTRDNIAPISSLSFNLIEINEE